MTFEETLDKIYQDTHEVTVYAVPVYNYIDNHEVPVIGIKSFIVGYPDHDPIIDNIRFMICGTAYCSIGRDAEEFQELDGLRAGDHSLFVSLYTRSVTRHSVRMQLGNYQIVDITDPDDSRVRVLQLRRGG